MILNELPSINTRILGETNGKPFGIKLDDRMQHIHILGKSKTGKSRLIKSLILQDINDDEGLASFGSSKEDLYDILSYIPGNRIDDVILINERNLLSIFAISPENINPKEETKNIAKIIQSLKYLKVLDEKKVLLVNLENKKISELIMQGLYEHIYDRVAFPPHLLKRFHLYLDDFEEFSGLDVVDLLENSSKLNYSLTIAHKSLAGINKFHLASLYSLIGTHINFSLEEEDAKYLEALYSPDFNASKLKLQKSDEFIFKMVMNNRKLEAKKAKVYIAEYPKQNLQNIVLNRF